MKSLHSFVIPFNWIAVVGWPWLVNVWFESWRGVHITTWAFSSGDQEYYWFYLFIYSFILFYIYFFLCMGGGGGGGDKKCLFANVVLPSAVNIFVANSFLAAENFIWWNDLLFYNSCIFICVCKGAWLLLLAKGFWNIWILFVLLWKSSNLEGN